MQFVFQNDIHLATIKFSADISEYHFFHRANAVGWLCRAVGKYDIAFEHQSKINWLLFSI